MKLKKSFREDGKITSIKKVDAILDQDGGISFSGLKAISKESSSGTPIEIFDGFAAGDLTQMTSSEIEGMRLMHQSSAEKKKQGGLRNNTAGLPLVMTLSKQSIQDEKSEDEEEDDGTKVDDEGQSNVKEEDEEPVIDAKEIRNKLLSQEQRNNQRAGANRAAADGIAGGMGGGAGGEQASSSSEEEEEEEEEDEDRRVNLESGDLRDIRGIADAEFQIKQKKFHKKTLRFVNSESSEQENYFHLFGGKTEGETEYQAENDDIEEENSDHTPTQKRGVEEDEEEDEEEEDEMIQKPEETMNLLRRISSSNLPNSGSDHATSSTSQSKQPQSKTASPKKQTSKQIEFSRVDSSRRDSHSKLLSDDPPSDASTKKSTTSSVGAAKQPHNNINEFNSTADNSLLNETVNEEVDPLKSTEETIDATGTAESGGTTSEQQKKKKKKKKFKWATYKRMLKYSRKEWRLSLLGHLFLIAQSVTQVFIPSFSGRLLDATIKERDLDKLNSLAIQAFLVFLLNGLSSFFRTFIFSLIGERVIVDIRNDCFKCFISNEISFHDKNHSGELISRLGNDISTAKAAASGNISSTIKNVIISVGNVIMLFLISKHLFLVIAIMIPIFISTSTVYGRYLKKLTKKYQDYSAKVSSFATECFQNVKTVKAFSNEEKETQRFAEVMKACYTIGYKKSFSSGLYNCINSMVSDFATLAVLWYGGYLVLKESELTSGQLASVILYTGSLASASSSISSSLNKIVTATGASHRLFKLMDKKPKIKSEGGVTYENFRGEIEFKEAGFRYKGSGDVQILNNFNLSINPGDRVALVGQSGSGKSTIIRLIERFYDVTSGTLSIDGHNIKDLDLKFFHSHIGYVSQEPLLFSGTIEDNITYGLRTPYTVEMLDEVSKLANSYEFISDPTAFPLGYKTLVGEAGAKLSGGQKQRIAISRALILKPRILIFDEATSALDSESEFQVQQAIDDLMSKQKDMTIIIIAHRLSTIVNCDKIVVLNKGQVEEIGDHKKLLELNGIYKSLVDRQLAGLSQP